jgi:hypothetical protein
MDPGTLRIWLILVHVLSVLAFMLVHGISAAVTFRLRQERDVSRIRAYLELSNTYINVMYTALVLILLSGIGAGIVGGWWTSGRLWIWAALAVFIGIVVSMYPLGVQHFDQLRAAVGLQTFAQKRSGQAAAAPAPPDEVDRLLRSTRPLAGAVIGIGGIATLAWLMIMKPF